jgi:hypothetical protein
VVATPQQEHRHELADGIPIAMTGGSLAHNDLAIRLLSYLLPHIKNCRINLAVEIYRRSPSRFWLYDTYTSGETLHLDSLDLDLAIDDLYSNIAIG